jgi:phospholipase/carboxylesterase
MTRSKYFRNGLLAIFCMLFSFHSLSVHAQDAGKQQEKDTTDTMGTVQAKTELIWQEAKVLIPTQLFFPPEFDSERVHTLIIALHGVGGKPEHLQKPAEALAAEGFVVAVLQAAYPMLVEGKIGYDWALLHRARGQDFTLVERATKLASTEHIPPVVTDLQQRYRIDRVYMLGFSQGAILAMATGIYNSALFDGVVSFGIPVFDTVWFTGNTLVESNGLPVMLLHGREDPHARFAASEYTRDALKGAGYDVTFRPFDGGHTVQIDQLGFVTEWIRSVN